ncbi:ICE1 protein, partial [Corythaeola cristata]|nr:ICE1 protein [Corythaeola cristata]
AAATMMPGETPPPPAGTAAAAAACANCGVLQQGKAKYADACLKSQNVETESTRVFWQLFFNYTSHFREISALRCQVEQMLQKILPLEKCQEELGSLKAELEEKKVCL